MTQRAKTSPKRLLGLALVGSLVVACGTGNSETEQLRAELEELRQQIDAGSEPSDSTDPIESTSTAPTTTMPPDPRATAAEAAAAWEAMGHVADAVAAPQLLDGVPIAAVSTIMETVIWQWDGTAWEPLQYLSQPGGAIPYIVETYLRDLSGDGNPELVVHRGDGPVEEVDVYTPVFTMFIPVDFDGARISHRFIRQPSWRVEGATLYLEANSCTPYCAVGATVDIAFRWENGQMTAQEETCQRYREPSERGGGGLAICDKGPFVRQVQLALQRAGFGPQQADGYFGPATESAVIQFQHIFGMEKTGYLDSIDINFLLDYYR